MEELIEKLGIYFVCLKPFKFGGNKVTLWKVEVTFGQYCYTDITIIGALRKALDEKQ